MFDWITEAVQQTGYLGIIGLMIAENLFPPIPSELIMPMAGFTAAEGELNIVMVIIAGVFGSVVGALPWYYAGKWVGLDRLKSWTARHGRWLTIQPSEVDTAQKWLEKHGGVTVLACRLAPAIRTLISMPAGVTSMPLLKFLIYTTIGTAIWISLLAGAGYVLGEQYEAVSRYLNPVSNVIIGLMLVYYIYRVATFRQKQARRSENETLSKSASQEGN